MKNKIDSFNRANLALIRNDIQNSLNEIAKKYGMESVQLKSIRFQDASFSSRIEARLVAKKEDPNNRINLELLGLPKKLKEFNIMGRTFIFSHCEMRKRKFPIIATEKGTTKNYKFSVESVKSAIA